MQRRWKGQVENWKLKHCQVFFTLAEHLIIHSETLCFLMLLSHLSKSSTHIILHLRQRAWKEAHGEVLLSALFQKGSRYEGKTGSVWFFFPVSVLPTPALGVESMVPTSTWDLGLGCDTFILKKHRDQACPESRLQHLKVVFETKSTIRQQIPVFEKILAYISSVSLFYCHMRRMHSTYGLLRGLNC